MKRQCRLALGGQGEVHPVPELVRQGHHIVHAVGVVHQHEWLGILGHRRAERATALASARLRVNALVGEEAIGNVADARRERAE